MSQSVMPNTCIHTSTLQELSPHYDAERTEIHNIIPFPGTSDQAVVDSGAPCIWGESIKWKHSFLLFDSLQVICLEKHLDGAK